MTRFHLPLLLLLVPGVTIAQTKEIPDASAAKLAATKFVLSLEAPGGGFLPRPGDPKKDEATLSGTSAALRALKYLGAKTPNSEKHTAFVMACFDPASGGFADTPKGKPSLFSTSVGVMAATELGIPKEKYAKAMSYLKENAKTFEDVRIGAAAVEAWGLKDCPFPVEPWVEIAVQHFGKLGYSEPQNEGARDAGSLAPFMLRMGQEKKIGKEKMAQTMQKGQREDGGWGKGGTKTSDLETTYRVMRGLHMLKSQPNSTVRVREFLAKCRNADGGYGIAPGEKTAVGPTYFAAIISHWLDGMEK